MQDRSKGDRVSDQVYRQRSTKECKISQEIEMTIELKVSNVIDRPVEKVFRFYALDHIRNHPRWDPDIELSATSGDPVGLGTVIHRVNRRGGTAVEGTMEVVEFEPNQSFGLLIHDGPLEMRGRAVFEPTGDGKTKLTTFVTIPAMDASADRWRSGSRTGGRTTR
jgi:uncharacterized protein YndB with AHSA1/START domain